MTLRFCALGGTVLAGLLAIAVLPAVLTAGAPRPGCGVVSGEVEGIAATIRQLESGGDYVARASGSTASGAYQFLDSSWASYQGYPRAWMAPPAVQDAKAAELIAAILAANNGDVAAVPVAWYLGHVPAAGAAEWDTVPAPGAGNRLTPREYQTRWMTAYDALIAQGSPMADGAGAGRTASTSCAGVDGEVLPGGWALPGPSSLLEATADQLDNPHHDYPAWDWAIPAGTPIFAIRGGIVIALSTNPLNCYGQAGCVACGLGVTVQDADDVVWTYCHGSALNANLGDQVHPGQQILTSGNSGNSTGPHLHLAVKAGGVARCPQPLVVTLAQRGTGIDPASLPTSECSY